MLTRIRRSVLKRWREPRTTVAVPEGVARRATAWCIHVAERPSDAATLDHARGLLSRVVREYPRCGHARFAMAMVEYARADYRAALAASTVAWRLATEGEVPVLGPARGINACVSAVDAAMHLGRVREAETWCARAASLPTPTIFDAVVHQSLALETIGRRTESARLYHARLGPSGRPWTARASAVLPYSPDAAWWLDLRAVAGKTVLVRPENTGLGDQIQWARFVPLLRGVCGRVVLQVRPSLVSLLRHAGIADEVHPVDIVPAVGGHSCISATPSNYEGYPPRAPHEEPRHDASVPLESIPLLLGLDLDGAALSQDACYLARLVRAPHAPLKPRRPRVGIVWAGDPTHLNDEDRSLPPEALRAIVGAVSGVTWVGIQVGPRWRELAEVAPPDVLEDHSRATPTTDGFLADVRALRDVDLVLTVDSSPAHLAGSMGLPVWTILSVRPDARWGLSGERTAYYSTMRLLRRHGGESWDALARRVATDLRSWVRRACKRSAGGSPA